jgi:hypothetical protein
MKPTAPTASLTTHLSCEALVDYYLHCLDKHFEQEREVSRTSQYKRLGEGDPSP